VRDQDIKQMFGYCRMQLLLICQAIGKNIPACAVQWKGPESIGTIVNRIRLKIRISITASGMRLMNGNEVLQGEKPNAGDKWR
jgi:hypothetical protein